MTLKTPRNEARAHALINAACMLHNLVLNVHPDADYDLYIEDKESDEESNQEDLRPNPVVPPNQLRREEVCRQCLDLMDDSDEESTTT